MGRNNALVVSQAAIAEKVGIGRQAVSTAVKLLSEHKFIEIVKVGNLCVYRVNTRVAWQGNRGERYAHFMADVIAVEKEQTGIDDRPPLKQVPVAQDDERILIGNEPIDPPDQGELSLP
jgi:DNA-binding Lrp family transcriptional regulator